MPQLRWLVTGCSSGFGESFVRSILARGDKVVASTRGDVSRLSALKEAGAETISLDVTAPVAEINAIVRKVLEAGPVDCLVNNAGYIEAGIAEEVNYESYRAQFETNFFGTVKTTQALLPHFRERKAGTIVILGSVGGINGDPGAAAYCATKFALEGWHESLRQEVAAFGIRSIICEPGFFRTKVMAKDNVKWRGESFADYDDMRKAIRGAVEQQLDGKQPGDPDKVVKILIDVVRGEGVAAGKTFPERLPLGPDALEALRKKAAGNLVICDEWEKIASSTNHD